MAMDVLIRRLRERGVDVYAYVDDIALGSRDFRKFAGCMRTIDRFSAVSGLGINHDKTRGSAPKKTVNTTPGPARTAAPGTVILR